MSILCRHVGKGTTREAWGGITLLYGLIKVGVNMKLNVILEV